MDVEGGQGRQTADGSEEKLPGTLVAQIAAAGHQNIRIGSPSGVFDVDADVDPHRQHAHSASLYRTCRRLMQGAVSAPA